MLPSSLGGVPVFNLPICILYLASCSLKPVDDFSSSEHIIKVSPNPSDYEILFGTPPLDKFDADKKTFTLKFDIGSITNNSCVNILVGLLQSPSQWPQGHSLTIMFLKDDQNFGEDVVASTATSQFNKYNIVQDSTGAVRISQYSYRTITTPAPDQ